MKIILYLITSLACVLFVFSFVQFSRFLLSGDESFLIESVIGMIISLIYLKKVGLIDIILNSLNDWDNGSM